MSDIQIITDPAATKRAAALDSVSVQLDGLSCASCVSRVENALQALPQVQHSSVNLATQRAEVQFELGDKSLDAIADAIKAQGYSIITQTLELSVTGMSCASCVGRVEAHLLALTGVLNARVNLATQRAHVDVLSGTTSGSQLAAHLSAAGYEATPLELEGMTNAGPADAHRQAAVDTKRSVVIAMVLALPVFLLEMGSHMIPVFRDWLASSISTQTNHYVQFVLTTLVLAWPGRVFFIKAVPALLHRNPDMNVLVAMGTGAAWAYSTVVTFAAHVVPLEKQNVYFEAAAVVVALVLLGRYFEARAKGHTSDAIERLMNLQAVEALVIRDGRQQQVPIEQVVIGELIMVQPGSRLPVDGDLVDGESYVDESMITGEPVPVHKYPGEPVVGGTLNTSGAFRMRATRVGADTALAQIIRMVQTAQGDKLPIQALLDKVTRVFVPIVLGLSMLTFVLWLVAGPSPALSFAIVNAVAVLIIACPCAMGLATPTSIMVASGRAAEMGILFRKGDALQALRDATVVALDKTGTLTRGQPQLTDLHVLDHVDESRTLQLIASIEQRSEHPIAKAVVTEAESRHLSLIDAKQFVASPGLGVSAMVDGHQLHIGSMRFLREAGVDVDVFQDAANQLAVRAKTPIFAAIDGTPAAMLAVADPIRTGTHEAIAAMQADGLAVTMITGDNQDTANAIAKELGIDTVIAEVLPKGKIDAVKSLQQQGNTVAFVGDGINDAPALAQADVGVAIGSGTDVAIEAADVVLMSADLRSVTNAQAISRATMRNIKQNLFWAFAYNATLIPVAAGVLYPFFGILLSPILAAAAMAASSVCVVGNALRLRALEPRLSLT